MLARQLGTPPHRINNYADRIRYDAWLVELNMMTASIGNNYPAVSGEIGESNLLLPFFIADPFPVFRCNARWRVAPIRFR